MQIRFPHILRHLIGKAQLSEIDADIIALLYVSAAPVMFIASLSSLSYVLIGLAYDRPLFVWLGGALMAIGLLRGATILAYRRNTAACSLWQWELLHAAGSLAFALAIGVSGVYDIIDAPAETLVFAVALLFGYNIGVISRLAARLWIAVASLALSALPYIVTLFLQSTMIGHLLGLFILLMALSGLEIVRTSHRLTLEVIDTRARLASLAHTDPLTGLANRFQFDEALRDLLMNRPVTDENRIALHFIDLDHFKTANDTFGHTVGDAVLAEVGKRLTEILPQNAFAARLGGDEFVVVQAQLPHANDAEQFGNRIVSALTAPYQILNNQVIIGASVGISVFNASEASASQMIAAADRALYKAKRKGRGLVELSGQGRGLAA